MMAVAISEINASSPHTRTLPTPLQKMLDAFPDAYQKHNGWWTHDDNPRFDFWESPEGNIRIRSWTGRTDDDILSMGFIRLTRADLYAKPGQYSKEEQYRREANRDKLDLLMLAEYMCIDWQYMVLQGYSDNYEYTSSKGKTTKCVKVGGYYTPDGKEHTKHQVRLSLHKEPRFLWNQNTPGAIIPCGLHRLSYALEAGYLVIGEGGSDFATMDFHGIPFLGIPGADQAKTLDVELVKDIPVIYILEEPDQAKRLREKGQGFYKNMRSHLRDHGYTGDIYSIRFMEVTGYKDPSDLHKAMYHECKEQAEGPFRQEVHRRFIQAIEQAIEQAIPEGNESLITVPKARDWTNITFEDFYRQVWATSPEFLSPIQKGILCYLFLYMRDVEPDELGWKIDADTMAPAVGLKGKKGKKTFLEHLSYLHQKLGVLAKELRAIKEYVNDQDDTEQVRYKGKTLYIQPLPAFYAPGGYCVVTQDQHKPGGPRIASEKLPYEECDYCGSKHLKHYAVQCIDCKHVMYPPPEEDEPLPLENIVESTLSTQPQDEIPESPFLGYSGNKKESSYRDSITVPQKGAFGNPSQVEERQEQPPLQTVKQIDYSYFPRQPARQRTICCNAPFEWDEQAYRPRCSNPACPEKRKAAVA